MAHKKTVHRKYMLGLLLVLVGVCLVPPVLAFGQRQKDPLTDQQVEQLRENGDDPAAKIKLYLGFIEDRTAEIHRLGTATNVPNRNVQNREVELHNLYQEFTRISDELEDNIDSFAEQHADMRKILKTVVDDSEKWPAALNEPQPEGEDDFVRKAALSAGQSVHDDAKQMLEEQEKYFSKHKPGS